MSQNNLKISDDDSRSDALARLLPLWPNELSDTSIAGRQRIVAVMARALRAERQRGRAGHWAYDLGRHAALARALTRERAELAALQQAIAMPKSKLPVA
ncbi:MAG: hypothetical protein CTY31_08145 [Hyphomicrobium sp.]|nr:MAG: hypothetical protein CTY39_01355 [Hyphomicrobium sp.]PPC99854.1 MAG: hypothetical protein CTY31_08145 [Hyphomicrobium sp.]